MREMAIALVVCAALGITGLSGCDKESSKEAGRKSREAVDKAADNAKGFVDGFTEKRDK